MNELRADQGTYSSRSDGDGRQPDRTSLKESLSSVVIGVKLNDLFLATVTSLGNSWSLTMLVSFIRCEICLAI